MAEDAPSRRRESRRSEYWPFLGYRIKITDALLAAFTFGLFVATLMLWNATTRLVNRADVNAERQLRAYVGISDHTLSVTGAPSVSLVFMNYGQTPAYDLRYWVDLVVAQSGPPVSEHTYEPAHFILNPHDAFSAVVTKPDLPVATREQVQAGSERIFAYGAVRYRDAFGHLRSTDFQLEYGGPDFVKVGRMGWSATGNSAD